MIINSNTRISKLIEYNADTIDAISSINKHFRKLRNPILRKTLAKRVSISDAAKIGGISTEIMINKLLEIGFEKETNNEFVSTNDKKEIIKNNISMNRKSIVELDVRPILEGGVDPFEKIMAKLKEMNDDDTLLIINKFEPIPLLNILKTKGYIYESERPEHGLVHTFVEKSDSEISSIDDKKVNVEYDYDTIEQRFAGKMSEVDVRHLEMPMPMVTILEEIENIDQGSALYVHHKKLPQYLIPELKDRGYQYVSKEIDESNIKLIIFK